MERKEGERAERRKEEREGTECPLRSVCPISSVSSCSNDPICDDFSRLSTCLSRDYKYHSTVSTLFTSKVLKCLKTHLVKQ